MVAAGGSPATAPGADSQLPQILRKRLLCSEGVESNHCYTKEAAEGSADAHAEAAVGKRFSLDASDTPPTQTPRGSPSGSAETTRGQENWKAEDEAESTDGLPDQGEEGDLHYDWQFELMNSMPRDKALELARVLKRSEQEKAKESAKLRQEVVELKRVLSRPQENPEPPPPRRSCFSCRCLSLLFAVLVAAAAVAVKVIPTAMVGAMVVESTVTTTVALETKATGPEAVVPEPMTQAPARAEAVVPDPVPKEAPARAEAVVPDPVPKEAPARAEAVVPDPVPKEEPASSEAVPSPVSKEVPPAPAMAPVHSPMPRPQLLGAEVVRGVSRTDLWHPALTKDLAAVGPAMDLAMQASLKAAARSFPKITQAFRFVKLQVAKGQLDGRQVALQVTLQLVNSGVGTWHERTSLKLIHGLGMGLPGLMVGQKVLPGQHIDLSLQLEVPNRGHGDGTDMMRNMWVLVDGITDEPFGPLLVAEIAFL